LQARNLVKRASLGVAALKLCATFWQGTGNDANAGFLIGAGDFCEAFAIGLF
jgi:hypothetical protein